MTPPMQKKEVGKLIRKLIIVALIGALALTTVTPAMADNSEEVAIGILGGVIGGLILGEIIEQPRYHDPVRVYEYDEPVTVRKCTTRYRNYYDSMGNWVRRPVRKCYWVEE